MRPHLQAALFCKSPILVMAHRAHRFPSSCASNLTGGDSIDWASEAPGERHISGHDGDALGMDGAEVGVLHEVHEQVLNSLLQGAQGFPGPAERLELVVLRNLTHDATERQDWYEKVRGPLEPLDLRYGSGTRLAPPFPAPLETAAVSRTVLAGPFCSMLGVSTKIAIVQHYLLVYDKAQRHHCLRAFVGGCGE